MALMVVLDCVVELDWGLVYVNRWLIVCLCLLCGIIDYNSVFLVLWMSLCVYVGKWLLLTGFIDFDGYLMGICSLDI